MRNRCPVLQTLQKQNSGNNGLSFLLAVPKHISRVILRIRIQDSEDSNELVRGLNFYIKAPFFLVYLSSVIALNRLNFHFNIQLRPGHLSILASRNSSSLFNCTHIIMSETCVLQYNAKPVSVYTLCFL